MFSGIIDAIGTVTATQETAGGRTLRLRCGGYWDGVLSGASIAIDGVCLTLTHKNGDEASFDVIAETLRCTTIGDLRTGDVVNLQKSLAVGDRIDGHFVQGHVDAVAKITRVDQSSRESVWWFAPGAEAMPYIIAKGSIAIDGISLTIAAIERQAFSVALIPTTQERTTLSRKRAGARVNIETDILARTVVSYLQNIGAPPGPGALTREFLTGKGVM